MFWRKGPRIGVVELHGVLSASAGSLNLAAVSPMIEKAFAASKHGHVILDINSPGGSPVQSDLIAGLIRRCAEEAKVTVHAVISEVGASGGYWLACAADSIHANPMSIVGSIGVVGGGFGLDRAMERLGVERRIYTAGRNKARFDPFRPERPEDVEFARALMGDLHERFKAWVRERRGARLTGEDSMVFDGSFFLADQARRLGLVDGFTDVDQLVHRLGGKKPRVRRFEPKKRGWLSRLPRLLAEAALDAAEARDWPRFG